jgi:hypothetical protein
MRPDAAGKQQDVSHLDAEDQALHARFVTHNAEADFEWPDNKEASGKSGKADVKRCRKLRDGRNSRHLASLEDQLPSSVMSEAPASLPEPQATHLVPVQQLVANAIANVQAMLRVEAKAALQQRLACADKIVDDKMADLRTASSYVRASGLSDDDAFRMVHKRPRDRWEKGTTLREMTTAIAMQASAANAAGNVVLERHQERRADAQLRDARLEALQQQLPPSMGEWHHG